MFRPTEIDLLQLLEVRNARQHNYEIVDRLQMDMFGSGRLMPSTMLPIRPTPSRNNWPP